MGTILEVQSSLSQIIESEAKRNCVRATERGEEAWSEAMGRRTGTGCEAQSSGASVQESASLDDQGSGGVNPAVSRRVMFLPGEISPYIRKDDATQGAA